MARQSSHRLFAILICLFILCLLSLHKCRDFDTKQSTSVAFSFITRKVGATEFDFTPFRKHHRQHSPLPGDNEIDPRYGVEKRLVPTGPNPLHH
ncbi:CLAVATA3/ESR-RELATED 13 [Hibiscus trionum]|uniref:CLAVATA3/ESR-RELATED 13 n=1 Tax=Hibiscus trionum TaxID=183268 RepID=A0A9W7HEG1_HIBTR|nr:CLAVATA3/ESR-RELATED 13 [Hibiscus trionum]